MPGYFQQTIIIGAVGRDAEIRETRGGKTVASFSVAVTERWKERGSQEYSERTTWYTCTAWEKQAELIHNLIQKGQNVMVIGQVSAQAYIDKDGKPKASLSLRVDQFKLLGNRGSGNGRADEDEGYGGGSYSSGSRDIDDIPF